jgi:hypothetical protein
MTKINGTVLAEAIDIADSDSTLGSISSLKRMIARGERIFWAKRGRPPSAWTMADAVKDGAIEGQHRKNK